MVSQKTNNGFWLYSCTSFRAVQKLEMPPEYKTMFVIKKLLKKFLERNQVINIYIFIKGVPPPLSLFPLDQLVVVIHARLVTTMRVNQA